MSIQGGGSRICPIIVSRIGVASVSILFFRYKLVDARVKAVQLQTIQLAHYNCNLMEQVNGHAVKTKKGVESNRIHSSRKSQGRRRQCSKEKKSDRG